MFTEIKPTDYAYRKPTFTEWLGHVFVGHPEDNYSHLATTLIFGGLEAFVASAVFTQAINALSRGNGQEFAACVVIAATAGLPLAAQTWLLGTEGWSPEYRELALARDRQLDGEYIPPQL